MTELRLPDNLFGRLPRAYLVGGAVRDLIRGVDPQDYDIAVSSSPEKIAHLIAERLGGKIVKLGKDQFSLYRIVSDSLEVDITALKNNDIEQDLKRRDFTINAMAYDLASKDVIDTTGGLKDLSHRRVRMVSRDAFAKDPVRLIRAFRIASNLNFTIESRTLGAICRHASQIKTSAGERVWAELGSILACPNSITAVRAMADTTLLFAILSELAELKGCRQNHYHTSDVFNHTMEAYCAMEKILHRPEPSLPGTVLNFISDIDIERRIRSKIAVLLHDIGKPSSRSLDDKGHAHFYGHAVKGAGLARNICRRLHMSIRQQQWIETVIRYHQRPLSLFLAQQRHRLRPRSMGRFFRQCGQLTPYVLIHGMADAEGKQGPGAENNEALYDFYIHLLSTYLEPISRSLPVPVVNGNDVMDIFNIPPSPLLGRILNKVKELQMAGALTEREQAIRWISKYLNAQYPQR
jgi:tRNA nucleotidyltransferase/poly(A) polymerase